MKPLILLPLVLFIAIAGYQFGYYQAKLTYSEQVKARQQVEDDKRAAQRQQEAQNNAPATLAVLPGLSAVQAATRTESMSGVEVLHENLADNVRKAIEASPDTANLTVIAVNCDDLCEVTGDYKGEQRLLEALLSNIAITHGWKSVRRADEVQQVGEKTHFIVHIDASGVSG